MTAYEPGAVWNQPRGDYMVQAMEDLALTDHDLEEAELVADHVPMGDYPTLDQLYHRAWVLQEADEGR